MKLKELRELVDNDRCENRFVPMLYKSVYYDRALDKYWLYDNSQNESLEEEAYEVELVGQLTYYEDFDTDDLVLCPYEDETEEDWYDLSDLIDNVACGMEQYGIDFLWFDIVEKGNPTRFERIESFHPFSRFG